MAGEHANRIVSAVGGGTGAHGDPAIIASWRRCLEDHALEPDRIGPPRMLTGAELKDVLTPAEALLAIATPEMDRLHLRLADSDYVVSLATAEGVTVSFRCARKLESEMHGFGLAPGTVWTEDRQGTNGIGTCLRTGEALSVVADDHFGDFVTKLSCTVAPVMGRGRRPAFVLNVTTPRSTDHEVQRILRGVVSHSARRIENAWFNHRNGGMRIVRLTPHGDFLDAAAEARLALDDEGRVRDATGMAAGLCGISPETLVGIRFKTLFRSADDGPRADGATWLAPRQGDRRLLAKVDRPARPRLRPAPARPQPARTPPAVVEGVRLHLAAPALDAQVSRARKLLDAGLPILVQGETGAGKSLLARRLHQLSRRSAKPFEALNCAAIPATLIEAELFGYRPGAFTGAAREGSRGRLLDADGGVLFLDEIGDMPLDLQSRLLHVLSERTFTPLGGSGAVSVDVAVISASHRDVAALVSEGRFREDLYHRLNGARLAIPPLRLREDRGAVIEAIFAEEAERAGLPAGRFTEAARARLSAHLWPGNLRELRHAARYAAALREGEEVGLDLLPPAIVGEASEAEPAAEIDRLRAALDLAGGSAAGAAKRLGISRATFYRRMKAAGLT
ncbi:sigma-54-dependent Fis family transcriptional regulator [uncultured Albimonas sp.]|uniref:sigma-54-dependent Fis family transcriptional regulator n=1 Tax=uncultured Albimonas sp. TaxID=1331701 RepID=UPI0030EDC90B